MTRAALFVALLALFWCPPALAWWDTDWDHYKLISISSATGAGTNYQVKLTIGASTGGDFHLGGNSDDFPAAKDDGGDLRFLDDDDSTALDFWVEDADGSTATVWVEVQDDLGSDTNIYVYYGNDGAPANLSDGPDTFLFFDDFPGSSLDTTTKWSVYEGSVSVTGSVATCAAHSGFKSQAAQARGRLRMLEKVTEGVSGGWHGWQSATHGGQYYIWDCFNGATAPNMAFGHVNDGSSHQMTQFSTQSGTWVVTQMDWFEDDQLMYRDDILEDSFIGLGYNPTSTMYIYMESYSGITMDYDWIFRSKFVYPDAAFYSAGAEQTQAGAPRRVLIIAKVDLRRSIRGWLEETIHED